MPLPATSKHTCAQLTAYRLKFQSHARLPITCALTVTLRLLHANPGAVCMQIYNYAGRGVWKEDEGWVAQLGEGWHLQHVRESAYAALAEVRRRRGRLGEVGVLPHECCSIQTQHTPHARTRERSNMHTHTRFQMPKNTCLHTHLAAGQHGGNICYH